MPTTKQKNPEEAAIDLVKLCFSLGGSGPSMLSYLSTQVESQKAFQERQQLQKDTCVNALDVDPRKNSVTLHGAELNTDRDSEESNEFQQGGQGEDRGKKSAVKKAAPQQKPTKMVDSESSDEESDHE